MAISKEMAILDAFDKKNWVALLFRAVRRSDE